MHERLRGWRSVDLPWPALVVGWIVFVCAVLALASTGSGIGVGAAALLVALVVGVAYAWSDAPFDPDRTED